MDVFNDQQMQNTLLVPSSPNVSTLYISRREDLSRWQMIQDDSESSVLKGIASVGGLWAFLGGIFATLFGCSIVHILFGMIYRYSW